MDQFLTDLFTFWDIDKKGKIGMETVINDIA